MVMKLPEDCLANIISLTATTREACRMAVVSTLFRSVVDSNNVWECFLPPDHQDIIATSDADTQRQLQLLMTSHPNPKKKLFMHLANSPILIDSGRKSFFLDKVSGKKCFMINARNINIVWTCTPQYWKYISFPSSRFREVAYLRSVWWLEISLRIESTLLSPKTTYVSYLVFKLKDGSFGFDDIPVETSVGMAYEVKNIRTIYLASLANIGTSDQFPKRRADGWLEAELGEVFVDGGNSGNIVEVSVMEVKCGIHKHGLVVEGIEFRPKE